MEKQPKVLRSSTIISDALYVDRDADRQLEAIIEDMGRPGYVLVARQMGKTNLLLRMKRIREAASDIVLYYDLSHYFENARDLFRHIIDGFLERIQDDGLTLAIEQDRERGRLDANAEYDRHLRKILNAKSFSKVVIVLDEIDSLVGRDYSDRILAQIRSMYFARANYPIYDNLTYVLSGVAEPTDLIKDKNISPFNIGEKIYLSDFSLSEVSHLVRKAGLQVSPAIVEAVYGWASGNPRMTWDIFSALEDAQRAGEELSRATVDATVERLYLTRHDRPPIDHIRALAETDANVRASLISLLYGKGSTLDDAAKSRLYLAGITRATVEGTPVIKNKIIESALSESWLTQVEAKMHGVSKTASNFYREGSYDQALALFNQLIETTGGISSLSDLQLLELSFTYYRLNQLTPAISAFKATLEKTKSKDLRNTIKFHMASIYLKLKNKNDAIDLFRDVVSFNGTYRLQAKHAISSAYLIGSSAESAGEIIRICQEVLQEVADDGELTDSQISEVKAASFYNLAQAYEILGKEKEAQDSYVNALKVIEPEQFPGLAAMIVNYVGDVELKISMLERASCLLLEYKPTLEAHTSAFDFTMEGLVRLLDVAAELKQDAAFSTLLDFGLSISKDDRFKTGFSLASAQEDSARSRIARSAILRAIFSDRQSVSSSSAGVRLDAARLWLDVSEEPDNTVAFNRFCAEVGQNSDALHEGDLLLLVARFARILRVARSDSVWELIAFVRSHEKYFIERVRPIFALYVQHEMSFFRYLKDEVRENGAAQEIVRLTTQSSLRHLRISGHTETLINRVRATAQATLQSRGKGPLSDIGRNQLVIVREVKTGLRYTIKFKKVIDRLASGDLELVEKFGLSP